MPQIISDNGPTVTILLDDGRQITTAKSALPAGVGAPSELGFGISQQSLPTPQVSQVPTTQPAPQPTVPLVDTSIPVPPQTPPVINKPGVGQPGAFAQAKNLANTAIPQMDVAPTIEQLAAQEQAALPQKPAMPKTFDEYYIDNPKIKQYLDAKDMINSQSGTPEQLQSASSQLDLLKPQYEEAQKNYNSYALGFDKQFKDYAMKRLQTYTGAKEEIANLDTQLKNSYNAQKDMAVEKFKILEEQMSELQNAKVDPGRVIRSPAGLIAASLMAISGAIADAYKAKADTLSGRKSDLNTGAKLIQNMIDMDLMNQQHELASKQKNVSNATNMLKMKIAQFGDEQSGLLAQRAAMQSVVEGKLAEFQNKAQTQLQKNAIEKQKFDMAMSKADTLSQLGQRQGNLAVQNQQLQLEQDKMLLGQLNAANKAGQAGMSVGPKDIREAVIASKTSYSLLNQLGEAAKELRDKSYAISPTTVAGKTGLWQTKEYTRFNQLKDMVVGQLRTAIAGPGTMSDQDVERILSTVPSTGERYETMVTKIDGLKKVAKEQGLQSLDIARGDPKFGNWAEIQRKELESVWSQTSAPSADAQKKEGYNISGGIEY